MRIAMVAGEASGDLLAAHLISALKRRLPEATFVGIGGPKMQREGFDAWWPSEKLAVHGYSEAIRHYREISGIRRQLLERLLDQRPDVFIGVDAPDFNLWLERRLKARGVAAIHYVSPSIWAWRRGRLGTIIKSVSHMLALFPFEPKIYKNQGIPVTYVGHPLADVLPIVVNRSEAKEKLGVERDNPAFALLPGSRQSEVRHMAETLVETAKRLFARFPRSVFLVPLVSRETRLLFEEAIWKCGARELPFKLLFGHAQDALAACDAAIVTSGTATLEAALQKAPMVIAYRMSPLSWFLMRRMRLQPWIGLPNILAGRFLVPELLQSEANPDNLAQSVGNLVVDPLVRARLAEAYNEQHLLLRQDTAEKAAAAILPYLNAYRK
jgi:lipid-A-disaccharide synthase